MVNMYAKLKLPKFDGKEFNIWAIKMRTLLIAKGLWDIVLEGYSEPDWNKLQGEERRALKELQHQNCLTLFNIRKGIKQEVVSLITNSKTVANAWEVLHHVYVNDQICEASMSKGKPYIFEEPCEPCDSEEFLLAKEDVEGFDEDCFKREPCSLEDPFGESYEDSCEDCCEQPWETLIVGGMSCECMKTCKYQFSILEGDYDENCQFFLFKGEYDDEKKNCVNEAFCNEEKSVEKMTCLGHMDIENESLIEETMEERSFYGNDAYCENHSKVDDGLLEEPTQECWHLEYMEGCFIDDHDHFLRMEKCYIEEEGRETLTLECSLLEDQCEVVEICLKEEALQKQMKRQEEDKKETPTLGCWKWMNEYDSYHSYHISKTILIEETCEDCIEEPNHLWHVEKHSHGVEAKKEAKEDANIDTYSCGVNIVCPTKTQIVWDVDRHAIMIKRKCKL